MTILRTGAVSAVPGWGGRGTEVQRQAMSGVECLGRLEQVLRQVQKH